MTIRIVGVTGSLQAPSKTITLVESITADLAQRRGEFRDSLAQAIAYAQAMRCPRIHLVAGVGDPSDPGAAGAYRDAVAEAFEKTCDGDARLREERVVVAGDEEGDLQRASSLFR